MSKSEKRLFSRIEWRSLLKRRWVPYLVLACVMTLVARGPYLANWRLAKYFDNFALDGCFTRRGALPIIQVTDHREPTKEFLLIELPYNMPPQLLAKLVRRLTEVKVKVIAIDLLLVNRQAEISPAEQPLFEDELARWKAGTKELVQAVKGANVVLGSWPEIKSYAVPGTIGKTIDKTIWEHPTPALWNAARWHAHLRVEPDAEDGITRSVPLFEDTQATPDGPVKRLPSLSLAVAAAASGLSPDRLSKIDLQKGQLTLGEKQVALPKDDHMTIDYLGGPEAFDNEVITNHYHYVLEEADAEEFANKIVFLGRTDYKAKDTFTTPFDDMPGVHVHMHATATLLGPQGPPLALPLWQTTLIALVCSLLLVLALVKWSLGGGFLAAAGLCFLLFQGCFELFVARHLYFPISIPLLAIALTYNSAAIYNYAYTRATFARFVGSDVLISVLNPMRNPSLGGQTQTATAFFCDLRRFSTVAERLSPEAIQPLVNAYTSKVTAITQHFGGRVVDYFGDGVFVLFRQPGQEHALQALKAALEVQSATRELMKEWKRQSDIDVEIAIGINSGKMVIGVVGSEDHMKLGAVGDSVNVAARVQGLVSECEFSILVTKESYDLIAEKLPLTPCGIFSVKGREKQVEVFGAGQKQEAAQDDVSAPTAPGERSESNQHTWHIFNDGRSTQEDFIPVPGASLK